MNIKQIEYIEAKPDAAHKATSSARVCFVEQAAGHTDVYTSVGGRTEYSFFASLMWRTEGQAAGKRTGEA